MKDYFKTDRYFPIGYKPTKLQEHLWQIMKDNFLNPIRNFVGSAGIITSGIRTYDDYKRLTKDGYNPSSTSDHFAGNIIKLEKQSDINKYGEYYNLSTFAVDVVFPDYNMERICKYIYNKIEYDLDMIPYLCSEVRDVKQLIFETRGSSTWIHISLPYSCIYADDVAKMFNNGFEKRKYLRYADKKYTITDFH